MEWHEAACIFPMLPDDELQQLSQDIASHGQREPIILFEGKVLDGRNRWLACQMAGIEPKTKSFQGSRKDALSFVWSLNARRRDLKPGQKAAANADREKLDAQYAAELERQRKEAPKGGRPTATKPQQKIVEVKPHERQTDHKIAEAIGSNRTYVNDARNIRDARPDLHEKVKAGELTIPQAKAEIKRAEKRKELEQKAEEAKQQADQSERQFDLVCGDAVDILERWDGDYARLIFTDPPYNIGIDYGEGSQADSMPDDAYLAWCKKWVRCCYDNLTDDGSFWLLINDEYAAELCCIAKQTGFHLRNWIKWFEGFGVNCNNKFNRTTRHIFWFTVDPKDFVFHSLEVMRPSDRQLKYNDKRASSGGKIENDLWDIPRLTGTCAERIPSFPTQIPLAIADRIVRCASDPGDLVIDPFNGSGTTGLAAIKNLRRYMGIDKSEQFIDLAEKRLLGWRAAS